MRMLIVSPEIDRQTINTPSNVARIRGRVVRAAHNSRCEIDSRCRGFSDGAYAERTPHSPAQSEGDASTLFSADRASILVPSAVMTARRKGVACINPLQHPTTEWDAPSVGVVSPARSGVDMDSGSKFALATEVATNLRGRHRGALGFRLALLACPDVNRRVSRPREQVREAGVP